MKNKKNEKKILKGALWVSGMLILLMLTIIWYKVIAFDTEGITVGFEEENPTVYLERTDTDGTTDSWRTQMRISANPNDVAAFTGATCPYQVVNNNTYNIKDWKLRLTITKACFLNGFWCGSFEIHQFRDGVERVNLLENQAADIKDTTIDHNIYSDNMMIRLLPGDYLVYIPSVSEQEDVVRANATVGIGFIFYYQGELGLKEWSLTYYNDQKMLKLISTKIVLALAIAWAVAAIWCLGMETAEQKLKALTSNRIRNFSIMADLYLEAYVIHLDTNSAELIKGTEGHLILDLKEKNVQEILKERVITYSQPNYRDDLLEFLDLSTVMQRLKNTSSIMFESKLDEIGWCSWRIFNAGDDTAMNQIVLTLQDINEEKRKLRLIEERMSLAEYKHNVSGSFLETVSFALNNISMKVANDGKTILKDSSQEEMRSLAHRIVMNTRHMSLIQNTMIDLYGIESRKFRLDIQPYKIHEMVSELQQILEPFAVGKAYEFQMDVDKDIPAVLKGDSGRIEQILVIILFSSMLMTQQGFVKFSLFGKRHDNVEELLFSIRDSAAGFSEAQLKEIHDFINGSSIETFDNASLVYLKIINGILTYMNSELKIVSVVNEGTDFYFTLRQEIVEE